LNFDCEYRPFKTFDVGQRSSMFIQLYGGFDIPSNVEVLSSSVMLNQHQNLKQFGIWFKVDF